MECPGQTEPIVEALWWHRQYEDDIAHAWLRRLIVEAARGLDRRARGVPSPPAAWPAGRPVRAGGRVRAAGRPAAISRVYTQ